MTIRSVAVAALVLLAPATAPATTAQRTFVASSGSDVNPCTQSQPCRSFAAAIAKTSPAGEVVVVDSAGYGPVKITQSVSLIAASGVYAGVTVTVGSGVQIDGSGIAVSLRGLAINGQGGYFGISFIQGARLSIEDCEVANAQITGILIGATNTAIRNTVVRNDQFGVSIDGIAGTLQVSIVNSEIAGNTLAGVSASASGLAQVTVAHSVLTNNGTALQIDSPPGGNTSLLSDGNTITYSNIVFQFGPGIGVQAIFTPGNNTAGYYGTLVQGGTLTTCCGV